MQKKSPAKAGKRVSILLRNGAQVNGVVTEVYSESNGPWVAVNTASGRGAKPNIVKVRESALRSPL